MKIKRNWVIAVLVLAGVFYFFLRPKEDPQKNMTLKEVSPQVGNIEKAVSVTGTVQPQNRLEMKPPVAGRIDEILVNEGQEVKAGDIIARMSSTERAALLDAAESKSGDEKKYWQDIYKPIPLIAPINGTVIVSTMQPGQTIAQSDAVVVLSDRLIVQAQVDETDIGRVKEGQSAVITLDAYPEIKVDASIGHIYHESQIVNNVTIYKVDVLPAEIPSVFRSGMSANVRIIEESKENVLMVPLEAVKRGKDEDVVFVSQGKNKKPSKRPVKLGVSDDTSVEVVSGIDEKDRLVIRSQKPAGAKKQPSGSNPFLPGGGGRR